MPPPSHLHPTYQWHIPQTLPINLTHDVLELTSWFIIQCKLTIQPTQTDWLDETIDRVHGHLDHLVSQSTWHYAMMAKIHAQILANPQELMQIMPNFLAKLSQHMHDPPCPRSRPSCTTPSQNKSHKTAHCNIGQQSIVLELSSWCLLPLPRNMPWTPSSYAIVCYIARNHLSLTTHPSNRPPPTGRLPPHATSTPALSIKWPAKLKTCSAHPSTPEYMPTPAPVGLLCF